MPTEKTCNRCRLSFPVETGFYRHPLMADGYLHACKACVRARVSTTYAANRPARVAYERQRAQRPVRKASQAEHQRRHRERHPERHKARAAVNNAIAAGRLTREPCEVCGTNRRVQAHHPDYSAPLDVIWLCFRCHREREHDQVVTAPDDGRG